MPLVKLFLDICLFRKGPQDAPASTALLGLTLGAYALVGLVLLTLESSFLGAILQVLLEGALLLGFVWASLKAAGKMNRLLQTMIALLGTDALTSSFAIPLLALAMASPKDAIINLLLLLLTVWHLGVMAHILRHALSQTLAMGVGLAIVYIAFTYQIMILLFGAPIAAD